MTVPVKVTLIDGQPGSRDGLLLTSLKGCLTHHSWTFAVVRLTLLPLHAEHLHASSCLPAILCCCQSLTCHLAAVVAGLLFSPRVLMLLLVPLVV